LSSPFFYGFFFHVRFFLHPPGFFSFADFSSLEDLFPVPIFLSAFFPVAERRLAAALLFFPPFSPAVSLFPQVPETFFFLFFLLPLQIHPLSLPLLFVNFPVSRAFFSARLALTPFSWSSLLLFSGLIVLFCCSHFYLPGNWNFLPPAFSPFFSIEAAWSFRFSPLFPLMLCSFCPALGFSSWDAIALTFFFVLTSAFWLF